MKPKSEAQKVAEFEQEFYSQVKSPRERQIEAAMVEFWAVFRKRNEGGFTHELIEWSALEGWVKARLSQMYDCGFEHALFKKHEQKEGT